MPASTHRRAARLRSASFNEDDFTIEVVWTTGARVPRMDFWSDDEFEEELSLADGAVRLGRLNAGAPFIDSHDSSECARVIGSVVRGTARIEGGRGLCSVQLSRARDVADTVQKIREGVIRNVSVGYWVHASETVSREGQPRLMLVTDWEPMEISAVPVPADEGSQIRSAGGRRTARKAPVSDFERGQQAWARLLGKPIPKRHPSQSERIPALAANQRGTEAARQNLSAAERQARDRRDHERGRRHFERLKRSGALPSR